MNSSLKRDLYSLFLSGKTELKHHRVAHALLCAVHLVLPKADADEGTAAVTDHDRDGQRHHIVSMGFVRRPPPVPCIIKRKESVSEL